MKKSHRWAVLAAVILSLSYLISLAVAQGPARPNVGPNIALLDVSYIYKNHVRFKDMMEKMKADVESAETQVRTERDAINKLAEQLPQFHKGTREYQQMEEELAKRQANLSVKVNLTKSDFLQREATIYHNVYQEILQATDYYSKQNGIDIVLRFNGDPADPQKPETILAFINRPVVHYQKNLDITPAILQELNRSAPNPAANRGGVPARQGVPFNK